MHIRISTPEALPELLAALTERAHYVAQPIGADAIAVSVLGSYADGGEADLKLFLAEWQPSGRAVEAHVEMDDGNDSNVQPIRPLTTDAVS